jgi:aspartyl/asparaginyl beta-hydroxylase (cupin superfamily)
MTRHPELFDIRGLVRVRLETIREARALRPGIERNRKRQIAQSLKRLIESQVQVRDNQPRRASR